jgi:TonB family protein
MRADSKPIAVPIGPSPQLAGDRFAATESGAKGIEASCQEVPIRALGHRAASDSQLQGGRGEPFEEDTTTMLLFPRGAVIRLTTPVACGRDLMLINKQTNRYVHCRITNLRTTPEVSYVEIEFTHLISDFWGISFPRDAAKVASAVAAVAAQLPAEPLTNAPVNRRAYAPAKAMAAAAGVSAANSGPMGPTPAPDSTIGSIPNRPGAATDEDDQASASKFFVPQPTVAIPVCEPVAGLMEASATESVEAVPALQLVKWGPVSKAEPRGNWTRLAAAAAAALCALLLGYHFYSPAEAALPMVPQAAAAPIGDGQHTAGEASLAVVPAGTSDETEPSSVNVVSAPEPEITTVQPSSQHFVLVSRMTAPARPITNRRPEAPQISPTAGAEPASAPPGVALGLLPTTDFTPPPPPPEQAPENHQKAVSSMTSARLVSSVQPTYPPAARQAQIQGDVVIELRIDATGNVVGMKVLSGSRALREAATTALAMWKFQPALLDGRPTASTSVVTVRFHL